MPRKTRAATLTPPETKLAPAHQMRRGPKPGRRRAAAAPAPDYRPGYFTELVRAHDWPPGFVSAVTRAPGEQDAAKLSQQARENREAGRGFGQGGGTIKMPGTPYANRPPGMMKRPKP